MQPKGQPTTAPRPHPPPLSAPAQAPELLEGGVAVTPACDVWSFGITLFELLTLEAPYKDLPDGSVQGFVLGGGRPQLPPERELPGADTQQVEPWRGSVAAA